MFDIHPVPVRLLISATEMSWKWNVSESDFILRSASFALYIQNRQHWVVYVNMKNRRRGQWVKTAAIWTLDTSMVVNTRMKAELQLRLRDTRWGCCVILVDRCCDKWFIFGVDPVIAFALSVNVNDLSHLWLVKFTKKYWITIEGNNKWNYGLKVVGWFIFVWLLDFDTKNCFVFLCYYLILNIIQAVVFSTFTWLQWITAGCHGHWNHACAHYMCIRLVCLFSIVYDLYINKNSKYVW